VKHHPGILGGRGGADASNAACRTSWRRYTRCTEERTAASLAAVQRNATVASPTYSSCRSAGPAMAVASSWQCPQEQEVRQYTGCALRLHIAPRKWNEAAGAAAWPCVGSPFGSGLW